MSEMFRAFLSEGAIIELEDFGVSLGVICECIADGTITEDSLRSTLTEIGLSNALVDAIIECLENAGIVFS